MNVILKFIFKINKRGTKMWKTHIRHVPFHLWSIWIGGFIKGGLGYLDEVWMKGSLKLGEIFKMFSPWMVLMFNLLMNFLKNN